VDGRGRLSGLEKRARSLQHSREVGRGNRLDDSRRGGRQAGLLPRDIILAVDGKKFFRFDGGRADDQPLSGRDRPHKPGDVIKLTVLRDAKRKEIPLTLGKRLKLSANMPTCLKRKPAW